MIVEKYGSIKRRSKYGNRRVEVDSITFDSEREAYHWQELLLLERIGEIHDLKRQVRYELIPQQKKNGRVVERACCYKADFVYTTKNGTTVVEDAKGVKTEVYRLKKKLMLYIHGIEIKEV